VHVFNAWAGGFLKEWFRVSGFGDRLASRQNELAGGAVRFASLSGTLRGLIGIFRFPVSGFRQKVRFGFASTAPYAGGGGFVGCR